MTKTRLEWAYDLGTAFAYGASLGLTLSYAYVGSWKVGAVLAIVTIVLFLANQRGLNISNEQ